MLNSLPIALGELTIRSWERDDLDRLAMWPAYPFPYEGFKFSFENMDRAERDSLFSEREADQNRVVLVADHERQQTIAYIALMEIDWEVQAVGNMGFRVEPTWCDKGVGTRILLMVTDWSFAQGIEALRLDVAASNLRAVRCYEKVGYTITGEFWREAEDLQLVDIGEPKYDFLRPHIRLSEGIPQLRFYWMESSKSGAACK